MKNLMLVSMLLLATMLVSCKVTSDDLALLIPDDPTPTPTATPKGKQPDPTPTAVPTATPTATPVNHPVSVTSPIAEGNLHVYGTKIIEVSITDEDSDGVCSWKRNGVEISNACSNYTADSGTYLLSFAIRDFVSEQILSWNIKLGGTINSISPTSVNKVSGQTQVFTASISGEGICEFRINDVLAQARGSCSYTFTKSGTSTEHVDAALVYNIQGSEREADVKTAYILPAINNGVSINAYTPLNDTMYFENRSTSTAFEITNYTDVDGHAWFDWYINDVKVDCNLDTRCTYTNGLKNGTRLDNYSGSEMVLKAVFTDGQYSAIRTWLVRLSTPVILEPPYVAQLGYFCRFGSTHPSEFYIWGKGFESSDVFTLQNQNITLTKVSVGYTMVKLRVTSNVSSGMQAVRVQKVLGLYPNNQYTTALGFVNFTESSQYCP